MTAKPHLQQIAEMAGATLMGDDFGHILFSAESLERFLRLASADTAALASLSDKLEKSGKKVVLTV
jgi:hypothetical protein